MTFSICNFFWAVYVFIKPKLCAICSSKRKKKKKNIKWNSLAGNRQWKFPSYFCEQCAQFSSSSLAPYIENYDLRQTKVNPSTLKMKNSIRHIYVVLEEETTEICWMWVSKTMWRKRKHHGIVGRGKEKNSLSIFSMFDEGRKKWMKKKEFEYQIKKGNEKSVLNESLGFSFSIIKVYIVV